MQRTIQPEILDTLSPEDPAALHNRRDLRIINRLMGNPGWFARALTAVLRPGDRILELGAGTGELSRSLAGRGFRIDGLDLWPRPPGWPAASAWHQADLRTFAGYGDYSVIIASFILHQFTAPELAAVGEKLRAARVILACEPLRLRRNQRAWALLAPLLGANFVSRHDAHVSIAAGFLRAELPRHLGLAEERWTCSCRHTIRGAYRLRAERRPA